MASSLHVFGGTSNYMYDLTNDDETNTIDPLEFVTKYGEYCD